MQYKTFTIEPVYYVGSDFRLDSNGTVHDRKQTSKDVEYYQIYDEDGERWIVEFTVADCKNTIDNFIAKCNLIVE